ncbi:MULTISPECIES: low temperature requirement protein A [Micromonospora]|uniref:Low temperature requirement protein LtrA n=1 Tax=Micromonospora yangpuensis TaxID=683228 RepID=A0A1C6V1Y5_9ACTN|nr:low temperature requirement protein A [Micromonospora yangpuensis]GGL97313.1 low temperature requirement protein A [Micromonospora yangpuensis]SCL59970.1 Low temperature requirement protein LtrA [Micromonospora yangpuensis]
MGGNRGWRSLGPAVAIAPGARVDRFEIFFDLVFVFSFFVIVRSTATHISGHTLLHALLVLAVLWWCWVIHSVVATRVRLGEGFVPVVMVVGMAALFAFALSVPQTIDNKEEDGLAGPLTVALSYLVLRVVHLWVLWHVSRGQAAERRRLRRLAPELVVSTGLLLAAALVPLYVDASETGGLVRDGLWATVILIQYGTGLLIGTAGAGVASAEHWTERYELILMIALGESVISVGVGSNLASRPVTWPAIVSASLGLVLAATLWWLHFDVIGPAARIALHATLGPPRVRMARDAYVYFFLPMIAGLVLFSLGAEEMLNWLAAPRPSPIGEPLPGPGVPLLYGGVICYLAGNMLFQLRTLRTLTWLRAGAVVLLAVLIPVADRLPALAALVLLTVVTVALVALEVVTMADSRTALREAVLAERTAHEAREAEWRQRWHDEQR